MEMLLVALLAALQYKSRQQNEKNILTWNIIKLLVRCSLELDISSIQELRYGFIFLEDK